MKVVSYLLYNHLKKWTGVARKIEFSVLGKLVSGGKWLWLTMHRIVFQYGLLIVVVGFLLGRATILSELTPFVLPYLAAIHMLKKDRAALAALSLMAGAFIGYHNQFIFVLLSIG